MFRKALIAISAASAIALGVSGGLSTADAGVRVYLGNPGFYYSHHRGYRHCHRYRVWYHHHWVWKKRCHRHY